MSSETGAYKWCMGATESDWQATADSVEAFGADYVMVVADELVEHAEDSTLIEALASQRASSNLFNVAIVPMQGIDASPDTFQTPVTIRDFIKTVYESGTASHMADGKLAYVLLLGDAFNPNRDVLIPGYYGFPIANFDIQGFLQCSDAYYSLLSEDPIIDDLPEVFLGRLPVDHDDGHWELGNVVNNILGYEPLPFAAWTDRVLMVSGGSTVSFTFDGEGGAGFENFFDSIDAYYIPANKSVTKMHRLTSGLGNTQFSKAVADSVRNGFGLLAMFDHGNYFELAGAGGGGCVLPAHYDTLNVQQHPVVLAIGSYLGTFDYTRDKASLPNATCCTSSDPGATCLQVPVTSLDPCDVLTERMVLQPGGAIGAFGYCRSQNASRAQGDFINLFRALYQENATRFAVIGSAASSISFHVDPALGHSTTWVGITVDTLAQAATLEHFSVRNAQTGLLVKSATTVAVRNGVISDCRDVGIAVSQTGVVVIDSTVVRGAFSGISSRESTLLILSNSSIEDCAQYGVTVFDEARLQATNTAFTGNEYGAVLTKSTGSWISATFRDCFFTNNAHGMWLGATGDSTVVIEGGTFEDNSGTGIYAQEANVVVEGAMIRGGELGISATMRTSLIVSNATIEDASLFGVSARDSWLDATGTSFDGNDVGLDLETISCVDPDPPCAYSWVKGTVRDCSFTGNGDGIWVENVLDSSVVIENCLIDNSTTNGVYVVGAGDVTIRHSTITDGTNGVYAYESAPMIGPLNTIQYNTVGIACEQYTTAVVESCLVNENTYGVRVRTGSNPDLGHASGGSSTGYNIFIPATTYYVYNKTSNTVSAEQDYWPASPPEICLPLPTKIYGPVDADPALCSPPTLFLVVSQRILGEETGESAPIRFELTQNFPNPFNPATTIAFSVPPPGARVEITLYDVVGRRVAELVNGHKTPGRYRVSWDGHNRRGESVASGVYFLRMRAGTFVETRKLHLIR